MAEQTTFQRHTSCSNFVCYLFAVWFLIIYLMFFNMYTNNHENISTKPIEFSTKIPVTSTEYVSTVVQTEPKQQQKPIGICFFGVTRSLKWTIDNIEKNIFDVLKENNIPYKIYLHTYDLKELNAARSGEDHAILDPTEWKLLKPDEYKITNQEEFDKSENYDEYLTQGDPWKTDGENVKNVVRQMNSLEEVYKIAKPHEHEVYLFLRPDLYYTPLDIWSVKYLIDNTKQTIILDPDYARDRGGLNDRFYFGTAKGINIIAQRGKYLKEYAKEHPIHAEKFLLHVADEHKVRFDNLGMWAVRVRATGLVDMRDHWIYRNLKEKFHPSESSYKSKCK